MGMSLNLLRKPANVKDIQLAVFGSYDQTKSENKFLDISQCFNIKLLMIKFCFRKKYCLLLYCYELDKVFDSPHSNTLKGVIGLRR